MKRILWMLTIVFVLQALLSSAYASETEAMRKAADDFYDTEYEHAISSSDSSTFEIGYRVCKVSDVIPTPEDTRLIQYDLVLMNKTDKLLKDLRFTAHFRDSLQIILASPNWYNEPMNLGARNQDEVPSSVIYTWNPLVVLPDLGLIEEIELTDFYDMLLEVKWKGGSELIKLNTGSVGTPEQAVRSLGEGTPLDEAELTLMLECCKQRLNSDQQ